MSLKLLLEERPPADLAIPPWQPEDDSPKTTTGYIWPSKHTTLIKPLTRAGMYAPLTKVFTNHVKKPRVEKNICLLRQFQVKHCTIWLMTKVVTCALRCVSMCVFPVLLSTIVYALLCLGQQDFSLNSCPSMQKVLTVLMHERLWLHYKNTPHHMCQRAPKPQDDIR